MAKKKLQTEQDELELTLFNYINVSSLALNLIIFEVLMIMFMDYMYTDAIIVASVIGGIIAYFYKFTCNTRAVFKTYTKSILIRYILLSLFYIIISTLTTYLLTIYVNEDYPFIYKLLIDDLLFLVDFMFSRKFIK